jgi:hypothetical protein
MGRAPRNSVDTFVSANSQKTLALAVKKVWDLTGLCLGQLLVLEIAAGAISLG